MTKLSRRDFIEEAALATIGAALLGAGNKPKKHRGVNLTSWYYNDYSQYKIFDTLKRMYNIGVDSISLPQTWYQEKENSTEIVCSKEKTPSFGYFMFASNGVYKHLENLIDDLKSLKMRTVLKPHVDLKNNGYRTNISMKNESNWKKWFKSYSEFIKVYATVAKETKVDAFLIGTELKGTTHRPEWNNIISDVRSIYTGKIGYAANWDEYTKVPFWSKLDFIGIDAYFPLTTKKDPSQQELNSAWEKIAKRIGDFSEKNKKNVIITEFGYQSLDGTNAKPSWAPTHISDELEQSQCYAAIFKALFDKPFIDGMYIWDIHWNMVDMDRFNFLNKNAEKIVKENYKK